MPAGLLIVVGISWRLPENGSYSEPTAERRRARRSPAVNFPDERQ